MAACALAPEEQRPPHSGQPYVDLRGASLVYGSGGEQMLAIDRLDLQVGQGEFVAVVGPSGCGKSTLMKLVTGLLQPDAGAVFIQGQKVTGPVRNVGMAFQNSTLLPWRTTLENVLLPFELVKPHRQRIRRHHAEYRARAMHLLDVVGLKDFAEKYPWELSGGMQQRANVCRALVHQPPLLMLDEPFGALDAFTREELWLLTQQLWLKQRFSAILVTHDLREAVFLADRVIVLSKRPGRIILERRVDLPRPRSLAHTYEPAFSEIVHEIRDTILEARA
ncbi:ABC transporter ATP-binding protein [Pseudomonas sp. C2L12B]|uniref:ABC transporter ATP-binding protein n=2 Tax=Pseudomonas typographi TaxID=2715964 RepID=A0ABR7Z3M5_9PSED|nr:ABC transporter ATP-binding protein [Pseudomonas typographi]MBD1586594.1 ABC transporter ATP-binding protein [Pseudomonas typographi]MBD1600095.1 ABC transporter ATP-binding protein [Pseudomonas typographi]